MQSITFIGNGNMALSIAKGLKDNYKIEIVGRSLEKLQSFSLYLSIILNDRYILGEQKDNYKKKKGYSEYEISKKREALENILIPYTELENKEMLKNAGFKHIETIFRWCNFATFLAFK